MAGTIYWITGLSGAGKTTVGKILYEKIKQNKDNVVLLDGDALRNTIALDLGYSLEERHESAKRNTRLCKLLADQDIDVICCTICMFDDVREWNRKNNKNYYEVYLKVPMEILKTRNQNNLYISSQSEVVGLGIGMEEPKHPDLEIVNDGKLTPEKIAEKILTRESV